MNGLKLDEVVGAAAAHDIRNALAATVEAARPQLIFGLLLKSNPERFDVSVHCFRGIALIEFERSAGDDNDAPLGLTRSLIGQLSKQPSVDALTRNATRLIHALMGYDRVMIYCFTHDKSGKVISETRRSNLESFLGQYFPATDIPRQARDLYLKNMTRLVADATGERVPIEPVLDASGESLDLSFAHLRSVSPIHCEYLRNMGVAASMSVSIVIDGALWGLIACHHYRPHRLSMAQRAAMEMFGDFFTLHLQALTRKNALDAATAARRSLAKFLQQASAFDDIAGIFANDFRQFFNLMPCDGIGLWLDEHWTVQGHALPASAVPGLARFVGSIAEGRIWATHSLSQHMPSADAYRAEVSGVLAVPLSQRPKDYLFFFRREVLQTLDWAGDPKKRYETGPSGDRLTPRTSFAIWKQVIERQSNPWTVVDREIAEATRVALVEIVLRRNELIAEERGKADARQRLLNEELNHRVKNILALIGSLVTHPTEPGRLLADYAASLRGRIQALAFAHDQVIRGSGGGRLVDLLEAELSPYRSLAQAINLDGPAVLLDSRAFSVMALVLHELATNAAKYGALSTASGRLSVKWSVPEGGGCVITWQESGGPKVQVPHSTGFGTVLVNRSVPFDLGGTSRVEYQPTGVMANFFVPAAHVETVAETPATPTLSSIRTAPLSDLAGLAILVVEDQMLIALNVETMLMEGGADRIETCGSVADALRKLSTFTPDVAVLDINLGEDNSLPIAEELSKRGIPMVFATGYSGIATIPAALARMPIIHKPYDTDTLIQAILVTTAIGRARAV